MARRLPSPPPNLPGFSFVRVLGSGGFADVFLYEQNMPRRQVAVKVMLSEVATSQVRQMFQAEANLMAQLSNHPSILTVYQASVSSDGRPYLVMELCSAVIGQRYRTDPLPLADALSTGIRIASAVETAHRQGVLHRDIKPSNILMTAYGHPVLSDFGIAATLNEADLTEAVGLSIPWSAPEVLLDETSGTVASEVWSLAATIYSLVAGRSPFEVPGSENTSTELVSRITKGKPRPIERPDVPPRLAGILQQAMSRKPQARQRSVLELIRQLQSVEQDLGLAQTPIDVAMDDWALATVSDPEERTRVRGIANIDAPGPRRRSRRDPGGAPALDGSGSRGGSRGGSSASRAPRARPGRALVWGIVGCAALVVVLAILAVTLLVRAQSAGSIPTVTAVSAHVSDGTVLFSWANPGIGADDAYQVTVGDDTPSLQRANVFRVAAKPGERVCIVVRVNRGGQNGPPSRTTCAERPGGS